MNKRGNGANKSKESILAYCTDLVMVYAPIYQSMPKSERIKGAPLMFFEALWNIIGDFYIAKNCKDVRVLHIQMIFGEYGKMESSFQIMDRLKLLTDKQYFAIAEKLANIKEGVAKWHRSLSMSCGADGQRTYGSSVLYQQPSQESAFSTKE